MTRSILLLITSLWAATCAAHNGHYYRLHPNELQRAIETCFEQPSSDANCEELKEIASHVNQLAYQLRISPQGYGQKILELQELIATQKAAIQKEPNQPELQVLLAKNKQLLQERLAIVRWLESPES